MDISNRSRNSYSIGLTRDHEGIEGRTLFVHKKERRTGLPESLRDEKGVQSLASKGKIVLSDSQEAKAEAKPKKRRKILPGSED